MTKITVKTDNHLDFASELFALTMHDEPRWNPPSHTGRDTGPEAGAARLGFQWEPPTERTESVKRGGRDSLMTGRACRDTSHKIMTRRLLFHATALM